MAKPKIGGSSTLTIDKSKFNYDQRAKILIEDLMKSSKGLPGDLLHFK